MDKNRRLPLNGDLDDNKVPPYDDSLDSVYEQLEKDRKASKSPDDNLGTDFEKFANDRELKSSKDDWFGLA